MFPRPVVALLAIAFAAGPGSAGQPPSGVGFSRLGGAWRPIWFLCDADGPALLTVGRPTAGAVTIGSYGRRSLAAGPRQRYRLGRADPGAGQIYHALSRGGRQLGNLHATNPEMIDPPPDVPAFSSITQQGRTARCRLLPGSRMIGVTRQRTIVIARERDGLVYRAYPLAAAADLPSITLRGGAMDDGGYIFAQGPYRYRITVGLDHAGGSVTVTRNGRALAAEPLLAYAAARD